MGRYRVVGDARHRMVDEAAVIELMLVRAWPMSVRSGERAACEAQARALLARCVANGLTWARGPDGAPRFDPVEALNFAEWAALEGREPVWGAASAATARSLVRQAHRLVDGQAPPSALPPRRYAVILRRTFNLDGFAAGERVRLRLPMPIEDAALRDLEVEVEPPEGLMAGPQRGPARLDAVIAAPGRGEAVFGARYVFTAAATAPTGPAPPLDPADAELYTRPSEGLIKVSPAVEALAGRLAEGAADPWAFVRRVWDFMIDEVSLGSVHHDLHDPMRPLDWILENRWCDCQTGSALAVALCRAQGLPSRMVSGYMLYPPAPGFHAWYEVWLEPLGWVPFDLQAFDLAAGGVDVAWRDYYFGQIDHRMTVERPPRLFGGSGSVRLPSRWNLLAAAEGAGTLITFQDCETGAVVWRDYLEVARLD